MLSKNNYNTAKQKEVDTFTHIPESQTHQFLHNETSHKRAFTITSAYKQTDNISQNGFSSQLSNTQMTNKEGSSNESVESAQFPSLEQLEALIRGKEDEKQIYISQALVEKGVKEVKVTQEAQEAQEGLEAQEAQEAHKAQESREAEEVMYADKALSEPYITYPPFIYNTQKEEVSKTVNTDYISISWVKIVTAIASSIITGVLIGYVLLLAVYGVNVWPVNIISEKLSKQNVESVNTASPSSNDSSKLIDPAINAPSALIKQTEQNVALQTEEVIGSEQADAAAQQDTITIQPSQTFTYTVLQAGVFTKEDSKQQMITQLQAKGYPASSFKTFDNHQIVLAAVSSSQQATYQKNYMTDVELYRKSYDIHVPTLSDDEQVNQLMQQWVFNVHDVLQSYMKISEAQFEQAQLSAIYEHSYKVLQERSSFIDAETAQLLLTLSDNQLAEKVQWHKEVFISMQELFDSYQDKPSLTALFAIQQQLLTMLSYEVEWFAF